MSDRFYGTVMLGGQLTQEQFEKCKELLDPCLEMDGEMDDDGSAHFHECVSEDFAELRSYCKASNIALAIQWDAKWEFNAQVEYWLGDDYKQFETDSEGRIVVQVADLDKHRASMTINEFIESLDIPDFPEFSIVEESIENQVVAGKDNNVGKLTIAGYKVIAQHGGAEGWKDIDGKRCFVDYWGGVWTL